MKMLRVNINEKIISQKLKKDLIYLRVCNILLPMSSSYVNLITTDYIMDSLK